MHVKVENGHVTQVGLPSVGVVSLNTVSGFNLLPDTVLEDEGWLPLIEEKPPYNEATQELRLTSYTIAQHSVTATYEAVAKTEEPPSVEEKINTLESAINFIIMNY